MPKWNCVGAAAVVAQTVCTAAAVSGQPIRWEWLAASRREPSTVPELGFHSSEMGTAEFGVDEPARLRTADADPQGDGRFYYRPLLPAERDPESGLRLEVSVRVLRGEAHPCATCVQIPLGPSEESPGPLTYGEHREAYQSQVARERRVGVGFVTAADPDAGQVLLLDLGRPPGAVLGRYRLRLDVWRRYRLQVVPDAAGGRVELSVEGLDEAPLTARVADLTPGDVGRDFGLVIGHPAGAGLGEAEWGRIALSLAPRPAAAAPRPQAPIAIGDYRQLFLDDHVVAAIDGLRRELGVPQKHPDNPVLRREFPWEAARCELYGSAVWNPERRRLQLFYAAMSVPYEIGLALAESADGSRWHKPQLELHPFGNAKTTNLVWPGRYSVHGPSVFYDAADSDPARRYKLFTADLPVPVTRQNAEKGPIGIDVATSPDGVHWTPAPGNPVLPGFNSDTAQCAFRDPASNRFVAFVRVRDGAGQRSVGRTESADFATWSEPRLVYAPTAEDRARSWQFYSLSVTPYEGLYVGLVWIFPATPASADWQADTPVTWPELVVSRDTVRWQRVAFGEPFLANGPAGSFDHRQIRTASSLVVLDDRVLLFYAGSPDPHVAAHKYDIGMATLRRDGFAAMVAGETEGTLKSRPLHFAGGSLHLNAAVEPGGYAQAALLDATGEPVPGFTENECLPCTSDQLDARITWRGKDRLPAAPEAGLCLRFRLKRAKLFAFWVREAG